MPISSDTHLRDLPILEHIETNPDVTQADLAEELGVAVGTINFTVQRLVKKGYVRVKQLQRRRLKYILTPAGIALRTKLAMDSLQYSMRLYRETREQAKQLITEAQHKGYRQIAISGAGDIAEVVGLTCLEMGLKVMAEERSFPAIKITGTALTLEEAETK